MTDHINKIVYHIKYIIDQTSLLPDQNTFNISHIIMNVELILLLEDQTGLIDDHNPEDDNQILPLEYKVHNRMMRQQYLEIM